MDSYRCSSRGQKMLSMIGVRLQKVQNEKSQWKASSLNTVLNPQPEEALPNANINESLSNQNDFAATDVSVLDKAGKLTTEGTIKSDSHCSQQNENVLVEEEQDDESSFNDFPDCDPYSSSDSVGDPDYSSESSSSSSASTYGDVAIETAVVERDKKKRTRKRKAAPHEWIKNRSKRQRNCGQSYKTLGKGLEVPAKQIKPSCDVLKCKHKCSTKFTEEERLGLFKKYWEMADIVKQRTYILTLMEEVNPKYRYTSQVNGRNRNHAFNLIKDGIKIRVCKQFFVSTFGITNRCIRTVKSKIKDGTLGDDNRGKHSHHKQVSENIKEGVRSHISSIPTIESHYTRAHSEKVYIEGSKTIAQLHRDYKTNCEKQNEPFKDQCQTCVSYQNSNEEEKLRIEAEYNCHIDEKNLSRQEKEKDKNRISQSYQVACFDLQACLPTPNGQVSSFYYKSKLSTYNFTVCDLTQKGQGHVNCYMWHEGQGKRGANEIGTCLLHYLKEKADAFNTDDLEIVFYSDNCAGQQKNKFVISAFLYAVANYKIKAINNYLVTGHTQNEGDIVHSLIEKNVKLALKSGPIYTPSQYVTLVQTEMSHDDFFDIKKLTEKT